MDKFKALVHFIIANCENAAQLGATRLNKILWFSDMEAYHVTGVSITGSRYVRRDRGPVPARILNALDELKAEDKIEITEPTQRYAPRLFESKQAPDESIFSDYELELVRALSSHIQNKFTATGISEASHDEIWGAATEGEEIPLNATLVKSRGDYRAEVIQWADSVIPQ